MSQGMYCARCKSCYCTKGTTGYHKDELRDRQNQNAGNGKNPGEESIAETLARVAADFAGVSG